MPNKVKIKSKSDAKDEPRHSQINNSKQTTTPTRIAIIGAGNVGATYAYALLLSGLASEIVLINRNQKKAEGEAMDLSHAAPFNHSTRIWAGSYADCTGAAISVVTAGEAAAPGGDRLSLLDKNVVVFSSIIPQISKYNPSGIILVATNPVDILTLASWKLSGLKPHQVIGTGTILDTVRFQALLGQHFEVDPRDVHASIIGEHGESAVPIWSRASIAGVPLKIFGEVRGIKHDQVTLDKIFEETKAVANAITERKGATFYGVAAGLLRITEAILLNQRSILTVSSLYSEASDKTGGVEGKANSQQEDVSLSLPTIIDRSGIAGVVQLEISAEEKILLKKSAKVLRNVASKLKLN